MLKTVTPEKCVTFVMESYIKTTCFSNNFLIHWRYIYIMMKWMCATRLVHEEQFIN